MSRARERHTFGAQIADGDDLRCTHVPRKLYTSRLSQGCVSCVAAAYDPYFTFGWLKWRSSRSASDALKLSSCCGAGVVGGRAGCMATWLSDLEGGPMAEACVHRGGSVALLTRLTAASRSGGQLGCRGRLAWSLMVRAAGLCGVLCEREAVESGGAGVAEQQVELPSPVDVVPVVGELLAADLVADEPGSVLAGGGAFDVCRSLRGGGAFGVPADVFGPGDDGLAAGIPAIPDGPVVVVVVVVLKTWAMRTSAAEVLGSGLCRVVAVAVGCVLAAGAWCGAAEHALRVMTRSRIAAPR